jgi:hypothetical protein
MKSLLLPCSHRNSPKFTSSRACIAKIGISNSVEMTEQDVSSGNVSDLYYAGIKFPHFLRETEGIKNLN